MTAYSSEDEPINSERASTSAINKTNGFENSVMTRNLIPPELSNENKPGSAADQSIKSIRKKKIDFQSM